MSLPRALNKLICRMLIGVFLLAQLAVAAYACPGLGQMTAPTAMAQAEDPSAMPGGCDQIDQDAANLCAEHCKFGQQSSDTGALPIVEAPVLSLLYELVPEVKAAEVSWRPFSPAALAAAASPPHAILHCVLRI